MVDIQATKIVQCFPLVKEAQGKAHVCFIDIKLPCHWTHTCLFLSFLHTAIQTQLHWLGGLCLPVGIKLTNILDEVQHTFMEILFSEC